MKYSKDILEDYAVNMHNIGSFKQYISKHKDWLEDILKFQKEFHFEDFTFQQLVYHYCYDITECVLCKAGNPKKFNKFSKGYATMCIHKHECPSCSGEADKKLKETCLKKYGVDSFSQTDDFKNNMTTYLYTEDVNNKRKKTCLEKYGTEYQIISNNTHEKIKNTNIKKYGVDNPWKAKEIQEKRNNTMLKKYGDKYSVQCDDLFIKIQNHKYRFKKYEFPSGKIKKVQGYENLALDFLLKTIPEDNILVSIKEYTDKIGKIYYYRNEKLHRYFPDIVVKNNDTYIIYEIKSTYTYKVGMDDASIIYKMKACNDAGYNAVVMVFSGDGTFLFENKYNKQDNE